MYRWQSLQKRLLPNLSHVLRARSNLVPNSQARSEMHKRYFSSAPVFTSPVGAVDRENGVIHGVTIARIGPAKGHEGLIDATFLDQLVQNAQTRPQGIKARFGHPNICATALGTYLGRFHDFSLMGDKVIADLHLDETARKTPSGNLFGYVLSMAENNPDMFGASIVFEADEFEYSDAPANEKNTKTKLFRLKNLRAADIVDEPAATDGLFSTDSLPAMATNWLDDNPDLTELIFSKPDTLIEFLNNYLNSSSMNLPETIKDHFRKVFNLSAPDPQPAEPDPQPQPEPQPEPQPQPNPDLSLELFIDNQFFHWKFLMNIPEVTLNSEDEFVYKSGFKSVKLTSLMKLEALMLYQDSLFSELQSAKATVRILSEKLAARPSIPSQVTDPQVSVNLNTPSKDEAGKSILQSLPPDLRYKLINRNKSKA